MSVSYYMYKKSDYKGFHESELDLFRKDYDIKKLYIDKTTKVVKYLFVQNKSNKEFYIEFLYKPTGCYEVSISDEYKEELNKFALKLNLQIIKRGGYYYLYKDNKFLDLGIKKQDLIGLTKGLRIEKMEVCSKGSIVKGFCSLINKIVWDPLVGDNSDVLFNKYGICIEYCEDGSYFWGVPKPYGAMEGWVKQLTFCRIADVLNYVIYDPQSEEIDILPEELFDSSASYNLNMLFTKPA